MAKRKVNETLEGIEARLQSQRLQKAVRRVEETPEQREMRLAARRLRTSGI